MYPGMARKPPSSNDEIVFRSAVMFSFGLWRKYVAEIIVLHSSFVSLRWVWSKTRR
jgi:hypothetical protein